MRPKGNCFDIEFLQDIAELGIVKGEQIPNVPQTLFRKDLGGSTDKADLTCLNFLDKFAPYIN